MTRKTVFLTLAALITSGGVAAGAAQISALAGVQPGQWELKEIGGTNSRTLCVTDVAQLMQLQHGRADCTQSVLDSAEKSATVHYTCAGGGNGRTSVTVRSAQSLKLETQGMAGGAPFAVDYDAKRLGDCAAAGN